MQKYSHSGNEEVSTGTCGSGHKRLVLDMYAFCLCGSKEPQRLRCTNFAIFKGLVVPIQGAIGN